MLPSKKQTIIDALREVCHLTVAANALDSVLNVIFSIFGGTVGSEIACFFRARPRLCTERGAMTSGTAALRPSWQ